MTPVFAFIRAQWAQSVAKHGGRRIAVVLGAGVLLFWLTASHSLMEGLSRQFPNAVLFLRSHYPQAAQTAAEEELIPAIAKAEQDRNSNPGARDAGGAPAPPPGDSLNLGSLREQLAGAAAIEPLNARTIRQLGQIADLQGDAKAAERLMHMAARLSLNETLAIEWMFRKSLAAGDYRAAMYYADALLRSRPHLVKDAAPALTKLATAAEGRNELVKFLAAQPRWREPFLGAMISNVTDARTPFEIFVALRDTPAPPRQIELSRYVSFLTSHKFFDLAYFTWLQFLPPEQLDNLGFLYNGGFERAPSGFPFDWSVGRGSGVTVEIAPRLDADDKHALLVAFSASRASFPPVSQWIALPPGAYQFKGSLKGELSARRGLQWSVSCIGRPQAIAESEIFVGRYRDWKNFEFSLTIPETGCGPQIVKLSHVARSPSEQMASGAMWFDDLSIDRQPEN